MSPSPHDDALSEGDRLTASITEEIVYEGRRIYLKFEANVAVLPGEDADYARLRTVRNVISGINETINAYYDWKES